MIKLPGKILLVSLLGVVVTVPPALCLIHMDTEELIRQADSVVVGEVISVDAQIQSTTAQIRVLQSLKGTATAGSLVTVQTGSGRVFVDESEPTFLSPQHNLLFLQKAGAGYVCLNRADGQKIIRNDNVYPFHDNGSYSVPLKDYIKALETAFKAVSRLETAQAGPKAVQA